MQDFKHALFPPISNKVFNLIKNVWPFATVFTSIVPYIRQHYSFVIYILFGTYFTFIIYSYASNNKELRQLRENNRRLENTSSKDETVPEKSSFKLEVTRKSITIEASGSDALSEGMLQTATELAGKVNSKEDNRAN